LAVGFWRDVAEMRSNWQADKRWEPGWSADQREAGHAGWQKAIEHTLNWIEVENP
jgi:glycerol kinase